MAPFSARNASQLAGGFMPMVRNNSIPLTQAGIGLLTGQTASQQAALGAQGFLQGRQTNQTAKWLQTIDPMLAQAVSRGALPIADAVKLAYGQKLKAQTPESTNAIDLTEWRRIGRHSMEHAAAAISGPERRLPLWHIQQPRRFQADRHGRL